MPSEQAWAELMQKVYVPAFIEKLAADYGVKIADSEQLKKALKRAAKLRKRHDAHQQKLTGSHADELVAFGSYLDQLPVGSSQRSDAVASKTIKQTAKRHAADSDLARAVLSLVTSTNQSAGAGNSGPHPKT